MKKYIILSILLVFVLPPFFLLPVSAQNEDMEEEAAEGAPFQFLLNLIKSLQEQIKSLFQKVAELFARQEKSEACIEYNQLSSEVQDACATFPYPGIDGCVWFWESFNRARVDRLGELKPLYLDAAERCGVSLEEENRKSREFIERGRKPRPESGGGFMQL